MDRLRRILVVTLIAIAFYFVWLRQFGMRPSTQEMRIGVGLLLAGAAAIAIDSALSRRAARRQARQPKTQDPIGGGPHA